MCVLEVVKQVMLMTSLLGVLAMAASGALVAINRQLDMFGVVLLGVITAMGGGVLRDTLMGRLPPMLFREPIYIIYVVSAVIVSLIIFILAYFFQSFIHKNEQLLLQTTNIFDAIGLGAFTIVGTETAMSSEYGNNSFFVISIGVIAGVGGGILRDIISGQVPVVLRKRIYVVAAIAGSVLYYYLCCAGVPTAIVTYLAMGIVLFIRMLATYFKWNLPHVVMKKSLSEAADRKP